MSVAIVITDKVSLGSTDYEYHGQVTLDSSYPTGGEAIDLTLASGIVGPAKIKAFYPQFPTAGIALPKWDQVNSKLLMISAVAGTEVANTTDLSASVIPFRVIAAV